MADTNTTTEAVERLAKWHDRLTDGRRHQITATGALTSATLRALARERDELRATVEAKEQWVAEYTKCSRTEHLRMEAAVEDAQYSRDCARARKAAATARAEKAEAERDALLAVAKAARAYRNADMFEATSTYDDLGDALDALPSELRARMDREG
jgi:hypothetical protein